MKKIKRIKAVAVFFEVSMHCSHKSLVDMRGGNQSPSDLAIFVNRSLTAYKVMIGTDLLAHYKSPSRLTLADICSLPEVFGGEPLILSKDVREGLLEVFKQKLSQAA